MAESILSVGIDIGTTTTQLVFSRLTVADTASGPAVPRLRIVEREIVYRSQVHLTPLVSATAIAAEALAELIAGEYRRAGIRPEEVGSGAVILTGETARKENAAEVAATLAGWGGDFVVAAAGPALESILAGKGAGADRLSRRRGDVVANLDIGGGTSNIAVFADGEVIDTGCYDIGGRLLRLRPGSREVAALSAKMRRLLERLGLGLKEGDRLEKSIARCLAARLAEILEEALGLRQASDELALLVTDRDLRRDYELAALSLSGGVADCLFSRTERADFAYDDLGVLLGRALAESRLCRDLEVLQPGETIGATVVGVGSYSTELSGSTITVASEALPLVNVPVLKLSAADEARPFEQWPELISRRAAWFRPGSGPQQLALAFKGPENPSFERIQALAQAIVAGSSGLELGDAPLVVVLENDLAKALGQSLKAELGGSRRVVCIDTVRVEDGDYIDIGRELGGGRAVPVIVKTLLYSYERESRGERG